MKTWKKLLAVLLVIITFTYTTAICEKKAEASVGAAVLTITGAVVTAYGLVQIHERAYQSYHDGVWSDIHEWASKNLGIVGHMMTMNTEAEFFDNIIKPVLVRHGILSNEDTMNETSFDKWKTYVDNHYELNNDGTITYDNSIKAIFNDLIEQDRNNNKMYYGYSVDLQYYTNNSAVQNVVETYQDTHFVFVAGGGNPPGAFTCVLIPHGVASFVYGQSINSEKFSIGGIYDTQTFNNYSGYKYITINGTTASALQNNPNLSGKTFYCAKRSYDYRESEYPIYYQSWQNDLNFVSYGKRFMFDVFGTYSLFTSTQHGELPYYTDNSVYNDWSQSSGDYISTVNNSNFTTYGDINNYRDSFNTENGFYPSSEDINIYINDNNEEQREIINNNQGGQGGEGGQGGQGGQGGTATATANNEGINITVNNNHSLIIGGSSLSGNTVSGNGSGESGSGGIFDFLGQIGHTIGNFVKNIGQVLADIVTGLGEVVSSLLESIPTIFGDFLAALIGWLPTELQALITLSITAMILVGLIKLFRG